MASTNAFWKSTIVGGIFMLLAFLVIGMIGGMLFGFDIATLPGTRAMTDPVSMLTFLYPFVFAAGTYVLYTHLKSHLKGSHWEKGMGFTKILTVASVIPLLVLLVGSMNYPMGFYVTNVVQGIVGYLGLGSIFSWAEK